MNIQKGDRVTTPDGLGEVIDDRVYNQFLSSFSEPKIQVKLDKSGKVRDSGKEDLKIDSKKPTLKEAIDAAEKIEEQINEIPNIPTREKEELPNHLKYFKEDIQVNSEPQKQSALKNLDYVDRTLKEIRKTNSTATDWDKIDSNLKILHWFTKQVSENKLTSSVHVQYRATYLSDRLQAWRGLARFKLASFKLPRLKSAWFKLALIKVAQFKLAKLWLTLLKLALCAGSFSAKALRASARYISSYYLNIFCDRAFNRRRDGKERVRIS